MRIKRLLLDVDKALARPSILEIARAIDGCAGVEAFNITVGDVDIETLDMNITIEGEDIDYEQIVSRIEDVGAVVHGVEQLAAGTRLIEGARRAR